jgi:hypothetical protein
MTSAKINASNRMAPLHALPKFAKGGWGGRDGNPRQVTELFASVEAAVIIERSCNGRLNLTRCHLLSSSEKAKADVQ